MTSWSARSCVAILALSVIALAGQNTEAGVMFYTSSSDFATAISGYSTSVEDYSGFTAGDLVNNGDTFDGLTYSNFIAGPGGTLQGGIITDLYNSFSGLSLGGNQSTGDQFFYGQDQFTVSFANPVNAFGIYFNVNPDSGNYTASTSVGLGSTGSTSYDTDTFVFVGIVSTTSFTSATISSTDATLGSFNIPAIITATVPEPSTLMMSAMSAMVVGAALLRSRLSGPSPRRSGSHKPAQGNALGIR